MKHNARCVALAMERVEVCPATMITETSILELLSRAKAAIEAGETSLRAAAEDLAAAQERGATQPQIAEAVGKSAAWVNRLLKWREKGYNDATPFGPQATASRQRAQGVQATKQRAKNVVHY